MEPTNIYQEARQVLEANDQGSYMQPAAGLYPHQWLWDSCFCAIGLRHLDIERAKAEILSLIKGQWHNGMLPNIIFNQSSKYATDRRIWRSWTNPNAPEHMATSGITQPPLLAEAIVSIGKKLNNQQRHAWYKQVYPSLLRYHQWLYNERDPHQEGLVLLIHPWEVGMDNTPPWISELHDHQQAWWIRAIDNLGLDRAINLFRRDTKVVPNKQRFDAIESLAMFDLLRRLRRKSYDINRILDRSLFAIEDVAFNSILIRNNNHLIKIARNLKIDVPSELLAAFKRSETALEQLWDETNQQYYSRDFITHRLLKQDSIASFLPLYAGTISIEKAKQLADKLLDVYTYATKYPLPSVPQNSSWYKPNNYWQGPAWVNINWLIIQGLKRYGFIEQADELRSSTLSMVTSSGCYEYFNPESGQGIGVANFSWTAALTIDLLSDTFN